MWKMKQLCRLGYKDNKEIFITKREPRDIECNYSYFWYHIIDQYDKERGTNKQVVFCNIT